MSALCTVSDNQGSSLRVLSKGAPEVLKKYMKDLPADYDATYLDYVKNGARVLTLAYKYVNKMPHAEMMAYNREEAEQDLLFAGFIVAECPLKPDTLGVMKELKESSHEIKMITGDNAMTAAFIGQQLTFGRGQSLFAAEALPNGKILWRDIDDKLAATTSNAQDVYKLSRSKMLCINGDILETVILLADAAPVIRHIDVFSRTSPAQKGIVVGMLNQEGHFTLMCGDGTNDVGSLKRADVGLAIVNNPDMTKEQKAERKKLSMWPDKKKMVGMTPK